MHRSGLFRHIHLSISMIRVCCKIPDMTSHKETLMLVRQLMNNLSGVGLHAVEFLTRRTMTAVNDFGGLEWRVARRLRQPGAIRPGCVRLMQAGRSSILVNQLQANASVRLFLCFKTGDQWIICIDYRRIHFLLVVIMVSGSTALSFVFHILNSFFVSRHLVKLNRTNSATECLFSPRNSLQASFCDLLSRKDQIKPIHRFAIRYRRYRRIHEPFEDVPSITK